MRVLVLGGDGFCGWPIALDLSRDHEVLIADNYSRRERDWELNIGSLTPIAAVSDRERESGIDFVPIDVTDHAELVGLLEWYRPDVVCHFAEQPSAPYSMRGADESSFTVLNNVGATHSVLASIVAVDRSIQLVHLGTAGVYGYGTAGTALPDGYVTTEYGEHLYPPNPGSVYHTTKCMDALLFQFYNKNWGLRITDLHQGIVWGTQTPDTVGKLINRFSYDGDYGTVLNRFLMQAALGHPLTVYGTGGQTRAFIHITDTVKCVRLAVENPPEGRVRVLNQVAETRRLRDLVRLIDGIIPCEVQYVENPRKESAENELDVSNAGFVGLGWEPTLLEDGLIGEALGVALKYADRADPAVIMPTVRW